MCLLSGYVCGLSAAEVGENLLPQRELSESGAEGYLCRCAQLRERGGVVGKCLTAFRAHMDCETGAVSIRQRKVVDDQCHLSRGMPTIHEHSPFRRRDWAERKRHTLQPRAMLGFPGVLRV